MFQGTEQTAEDDFLLLDKLLGRESRNGFVDLEVRPFCIARQHKQRLVRGHFASAFESRMFKSSSNAPAMIAMSATLKIPVLTPPMPTFRKSVTRPLYSRRSIKLLIPPPATRANATTRHACRRRANKEVATKPTSSAATAAVNNAKRKFSGKEAPRLRKEPGF